MSYQWASQLLKGAILGMSLAALLLPGGLGDSGYAQNRPAGDVVFIIDESGSMFNDAQMVKANLEGIVNALSGHIDFRLGLVGFGAFRGHAGTTFSGQAHVHLPLTSDVRAFRDALDELVTVGRSEPGFSAIVLGMGDVMGFRPQAGKCAILITDEDADIYDEAPETKADAAAALTRRDAVLLGIVNWNGAVDPGFSVSENDYGPGPGGLLTEVRGEIFNIVHFRSNPGPVLRAVAENCVEALTGEPIPPDRDGRRPPDRAPDLDELLRRILPTLDDLRDQVEDNRSRVFMLENRITAWIREVASLKTTVAELAERDAPEVITIRIEEVRETIQQVTLRLEEITTQIEQLRERVETQGAPELAPIREKLSEIQSIVASLQGSVNRLGGIDDELMARLEGFAQRLELLEQDGGQLHKNITVRIEALEQSVQGSVDFLTQVVNETNAELAQLDERFVSLEAHVNALSDEHTDFNARLAELIQRLSDLAGRVTALEEANAELFETLQVLRDLPGQLTQLRATVADLDAQLSRRLDEITVRVEANELAMATLRDAMGELRQEAGEVLDVAEVFTDNFAKVMERLDGVETELDRLREQPSPPGVSPEALDELARRVEMNGKQIDALGDQLGELTAHTNDGMDGLQAGLEELGAHLGQEVTALGARQKRTEAQLAQLQDAFGGLEDLRVQLTQLERRLNELEPQVRKNRQGTAENAEGVEANAGSIAELRSRLGALERSFNGQLGDVGDQIAELRERLAGHYRAMQELRAVLENAKADVKRELLAELTQQGGIVRVEVEEDTLTRRLAQIALAFSLAAIGLAWLLFMNTSGG